MGYHILHQLGPAPSDATSTDAATLRRQLVTGGTDAKRRAVFALISRDDQGVLTACLALDAPEVTQFAAMGLWECWLNEAGPAARRQIDEGIDAMNAGDLDLAAEMFEHLMDDFPDWAEAINKQATVRYLQGQLEQSIELCQRALTLKPDHFGAWNGLAICAVQREDWPLALRAVQESLRLQPHSRSNRQLLRLVESRLPQV